ncbi:MAG: hypothetical protein O2782_06430 [bacterium]|nr:hypothetical protein [bacterium]
MSPLVRDSGPSSTYALLALLCMAASATASTVVPLSVAELTDRSQQVFHGICLDSHAAAEGGEVTTHLRFVVSEHLKGPVRTDTLSVILPGGELDGTRYQISGMPGFRPGEEVVLFLTGADPSGRVWPVGLAQGGFHVRRNNQGAARVRRDYSELRFQGAARTAGIPADDLSLEELLEEIRARAHAPGANTPDANTPDSAQ